MKFETLEDLDIYHEDYLEGAMEMVGGLLGKIQHELERLLNEGFQAIKNPDEYDAHVKEKEDARIRYEELQSNYQKLRAQLETFIREKARAPDNDARNQAALQLRRANSRILQLETDVKRLQAESINHAQAHPPPQNLQLLNKELTEVRRQNTKLRSDADDREKQLKDANSKTAALRGVIMKEASKYSRTHSDAELIQSLQRITDDVRRLASRYLIITERPKAIEGRRAKPRDTSLQSLWNMNLPKHALAYRVQAAIFEFLNAEILLKPAFDLDHADNHNAIEPGLVEFEKMLEGLPQDNLNCMHEWRKLTLKCAKSIARRDTGKKLNALVSELRQFLEPIRDCKVHADVQNHQEYLDRTFHLCADTFNLSQALRAEPGCEFQIAVPAPGSAVPKESDDGQGLLSVLAEERGFNADVAGTVAYTLFGALVRIDKASGIPVTLKPALLIVKSV